MKENAFTSRETRTVTATLRIDDAQDVLVFSLDKKYTIHLKSNSSQLEIKTVFSALLDSLLKQPIKIVLEIEDGYSNNLLKDVCSAYIEDLNKEIDQIARKIPEAIISAELN